MTAAANSNSGMPAGTKTHKAFRSRRGVADTRLRNPLGQLPKQHPDAAGWSSSPMRTGSGPVCNCAQAIIGKWYC